MSDITFGRPFLLRRDGETTAHGILWPDGQAALHRGRGLLGTLLYPGGMNAVMAEQDPSGNAGLRVVWADHAQASRREFLADIVEAFDVPATAMGDEAALAGLHRQITRTLTTEHLRRAEQRIVASPEEHCSAFADVLMPVVDALLQARNRPLRMIGRAYMLADRWESTDGPDAHLVRAAAVELREELDAARDELDQPPPRDPNPDVSQDEADEGPAATTDPPLAAAECSAQHRGFETGPRLCIRAAQHRGDHIDENGFHWSDTVAVYPAEDAGPQQEGTGVAAVVDAVRRVLGIDPAAGPADIESWLLTACRLLEQSEAAREWLRADRQRICRAVQDARSRARTPGARGVLQALDAVPPPQTPADQLPPPAPDHPRTVHPGHPSQEPCL